MCMNEMPSAEFRKQYARLDEVTDVTVNGHSIGVWLPGEELRKLLEKAQQCQFCGSRAEIRHAPTCIDAAFLEPLVSRPAPITAQARRDDLLRKINRGK